MGPGCSMGRGGGEEENGRISSNDEREKGQVIS
jgi:hypothetical protein